MRRFKNVCTFDFIGDSIVEGANNHLKKGTIKVSNKLSISSSGITQLRATEEKYHKKSLLAASKINSSKTWSNSLTKDYLTQYAEGSACSNFDSRRFYTTKYVGFHMWYVCYSKIFHNDYEDSFDGNNNHPTQFFIDLLEKNRNISLILL